MGRVSDSLTNPSPTKSSTQKKAVSSGAASVEPSALESLNIRQRAAIEAYVDPSSKTFGVGASSYNTAYPPTNVKSASNKMADLMGIPRVKKAISELASKYRVGPEHRVQKLAELIHSGDTEEILNKENVVVRTIRKPIHRDAVRAIDMLNRLDGSYAVAEQAVSVQAEAAKALIRANAHLLG
jgi:hypothetical protein